jgi:predicted DNA-binding helix-hairpin-helix protein
MEALDKLQLLRTQFEPAEETTVAGTVVPSKAAHKFSGCVFEAATPQGRVALLKTLLTSACERDCFYCPFRAGRNFRRATFKPDEMAQTFDAMHRAGVVRGLFLSSGIIGGGVRTQDKLLATAELLRGKYGFKGYIHLKIMPGAERAQVERAIQLADRVSINLEAPNSERLPHLAPHKVFMEELMRPLRWVEEIRRAQGGRGPSQVTQFVVGPAGESDHELLTTSEMLYRELRLARTYFSAFSPVRDTPFDGLAATPALRERRLYQASFLLRDYRFRLSDLTFGGDGNLPLDQDPKAAWAKVHLAERPVEINRAGPSELLRIPGIGPKGVEAIMKARRRGTFRDLADLRKIGVLPERAAPYILLAGRRPAFQLPLFGG